MKLNALLKALFAKAGIPESDANATALLNNAAITDIDLADETANLVNNSLMNLTAAKNHPDIRKELVAAGRSEAFDGMDNEIQTTMNDLGIDEATKTKILAEKSTTKRAALLAKELKRIGDEKPGNSAELTQKVNDLNKNISDLQAKHATELQAEKAKFEQALLQESINYDLVGFNYIFPKGTPTSTKLAAAKASVDRALQAAGAKVIRDENGNKKLVRTDGTDYFDASHKAVNYNDFISAALAQDNLLTATQDPDPHRDDPPPAKVPGEETINQEFLEAADSNVSNLEAALKRDGTNLGGGV